MIYHVLEAVKSYGDSADLEQRRSVWISFPARRHWSPAARPGSAWPPRTLRRRRRARLHHRARSADARRGGGGDRSGRTGVRGDVSDLDDLDRRCRRDRAAWTGLDVVFANAGGGEFATLADVTPETSPTPSTINVGGTVFTVQKVLPLLNEGASIVLTGSTSASRARRRSGCTRRPRPPSVHWAAPGRPSWSGAGSGSTRSFPGPRRRPAQRPGARATRQALLEGRRRRCRWAGSAARGDRHRGAVPRLGPVQLHDRRRAFVDGGERQL